MKWVLPKTYKNPTYPLKKVTDMQADAVSKYDVVITGAGPAGLTAALDLANRGISSVIFSKESSVSVGSRALCFSKKSLEVIHRLAPKAVEKMLDKGVVWSLGKVFYQEEEVYKFNLLEEKGHKIPAFINLQQYYFEEYLVQEIEKNPLIDLRWQSTAHFINQETEKVTLEIETAQGNYFVESKYLLACEGVRSSTREAMNIPFEGELFEENFLIADVTMENDFPTERWFWFDPPFNKGHSALLHKAPDGVYRIDLQLGIEGVDKQKELEPERIKSRLRKMLGNDCKFELEWTSIYNFRCMQMKNMVHGNVFFAGDCAHQVSPFGARGANGSIQDTDNLAWKLAYVLQGKAPRSLLAGYNEERGSAADENIYHSSNATDFISPKSEISTVFRNQLLELAKDNVFAQKMVNSGRLSHAHRYLHSSLTSPDTDEWSGSIQPGYTFADISLKKDGEQIYLIDELGNDFTLLIFEETNCNREKLTDAFDLKLVHISQNETPNRLIDNSGDFKKRYGTEKGSWYLIRPDHYIASRGKSIDYSKINDAIFKATGTALNKTKSFITDKNPMYQKDDMYKELIEAHEGLNKEQSHKLNAKLVLLLLNNTSDKTIWKDILVTAKKEIL